MTNKFICIVTLCILLFRLNLQAADLLVEAESFAQKGGWVVDQQFMDIMGSSYLLAHGLGVPVEDASTDVRLPETGTYHVYVRTYNWTAPWHEGEGPGQFGLSVNGKRLSSRLGITGNRWIWQYAGRYHARERDVCIVLHDMKGFDGRCDAIYFTTQKDDVPPADVEALEVFRRTKLGLPAAQPTESYDLVVVGAGVAGISAAVSAARLGCKVALINDRPVVGGNNSSEIRVHLGGAIEIGKYPELGGLQKEFGPEKEGNAQPAANYEDQKKLAWLKAESKVTLFLNYRAYSVKKEKDRIVSVTARHIETGEEVEFYGHLFADCTGDGTVGYLAGADYRMGRESRHEFGESIAPDAADSLVMGASVQWYAAEDAAKSVFPEFRYGITFGETTCEPVTHGEWTWETGMNRNQITDFEQIRDYGMLVVYSNWSYLKNHSAQKKNYEKRSLQWVAYIAGKRESRRLLGDYVLKEEDLTKHMAHEDASFTTTWSIDLHRPDPANSRNFPGCEFKATTDHVVIYPYPVPYRCLYSRNIDNLFMAGRNISVTHIALGTVRVMRTTGMMGEVVGMAASLCKQHHTLPRNIYRYHLEELKSLMKKGVNKKGLPNNQQYNEGGRLTKKPVVK
ncbi:FAD-dependent oxidoreductase [uncultured Bacteroides sp.]|uniref:FAD-dependent oxidoreductase n=1 Tax=uncultured Bacteroides sp. TaxID=162156 RepID=UPI0025DBF7F0|nr:FAD-dependent oxidoreductase [uncultured Bacteroides sp.]